jgi:hypothetical protein
MSQPQPRFLDEVNDEIRQLSTLIDSELSSQIDAALIETLEGVRRKESVVNVLTVVAIQLIADQEDEKEVFIDSVIFGGLLSSLIVHYWHQMKARNILQHEAPNAAQ